MTKNVTKLARGPKKHRDHPQPATYRQPCDLSRPSARGGRAYARAGRRLRGGKCRNGGVWWVIIGAGLQFSSK